MPDNQDLFQRRLRRSHSRWIPPCSSQGQAACAGVTEWFEKDRNLQDDQIGNAGSLLESLLKPESIIKSLRLHIVVVGCSREIARLYYGELHQLGFAGNFEPALSEILWLHFHIASSLWDEGVPWRIPIAVEHYG